MSRTRRTINSKNNSVIALCLNREIIFRAAFLAAAIWIAAVGADAATLTVTKTADTNDAVCNGDCSLREAIGAAASGDTIAFSLLFSTAQTIALTDQLLFAKSLTIAGPGARLLTISGTGLHRAFRMDGAATVNIRNVKIANSFDAEAGGCIQIFTDITLNLTDVQLELCRSVSGAAIWSRGTLNMIRSTITTASLGAAIYLDGGTTNIANSTIKNNSIGSALPVAGIHVTNSGILKLNNATIADNDGEAVRVSSGTAYLRNTIVRAVNPSLADMSGTIVSLGNNLVGKNVGISTAFPAGNPNVNGDIVGSANSIVNPQLHTLANNGGQT
ncbi:MAG TPA: CSLREA domain-containing protein, partial [Pyrinomonadaceae bacterium]|nr:CSLREA domain-containing protein [Pyrinomonadaceae bacterium]